LNINEKNNDGNNPLIWATIKNNTEMVQLLIHYANENNIPLEINEKSKYKYNPLI